MWVFTGKQTVNISTALKIDIDRRNAGKITVFEVVAIYLSDLKIELAHIEYLHPMLDYKDEWDHDQSFRFGVGMNTAVGECVKVIEAVNAALKNRENLCEVGGVYCPYIRLDENGQVISL